MWRSRWSMANYKNRIIGSGEEQLDQIMFNPRNWRIHPLNQQNALKGVLEEIGWVQQVVINKRTGNLIDGHLRCQLAAREGNETIPVVYVDLSEDEEEIILASLDPLGEMAVRDKEMLEELLLDLEEKNKVDIVKEIFYPGDEQLPDKLPGDEELSEQEITLKPKDQFHILISVPVKKSMELEALAKQAEQIIGAKVFYGGN